MTKVRKKIGTIPINDIEQQVQQSTQAAVAQMQQDVSDFIDEETAQYPEIGGAFKFQEDPEGRSEITTDSEGKIISYRKPNGVKVENVGIEANKLSLTREGMTDFQQALIDNGFNPESVVDWSSKKSLEISIPRCAMANITNDTNDAIWPTSKKGRPDYRKGVNADLEYYLEFWDMQGNYFKKEIIISAQGDTSMVMMKKNGSVDICNNNGWDDNDTFKIKFGSWVPQDSFHFKAYYQDFLRGTGVISYQISDEVYKTRGVLKDRPWKKGLIDMNSILVSTPANLNAEGLSDTSLQMDNGARCMPDGFPVIFYLNGEFWGIYSWQLKKHRDNYHINKKTPEHVHLDGVLRVENIWNGIVNWEQFEVRNPNNLYCMDGSKYDGDNPKELIDATSVYYDSTNKDHKNTAKVKQYIINLSNRIGEINTLDTTDHAAAKALFDTYFDAENLIDYEVINMALYDHDGFGKNWQWITYDGIKWFVCQYDKDCSFGNYPTGMYTIPPSDGSWIGDSISLPTGVMLKFYQAECVSRWKELVESDIFTVKHFSEKIKEWLDRIGTVNFEKEWKKWDESPCNRDSKIDFENWVFTGGVTTSTPTENIWSNALTYPINEFVWYSLDNSIYFKFKSIKENIGKPCIKGTYSNYPQFMGYRDSFWRFYKFLEKNFENQNRFINGFLS